MEIWSFYFFAKLFLYYQEYIKFDIGYNLAFAVFLLIPMPEKMRFRKSAMALHFTVSMALAAAILWHDSWFPPPFEAAGMLETQGLPSREYIISFLLRFYNPQVFIILGVIFAACYLASGFLRMTAVALVCVIALAPFRVFGQPDTAQIGQEAEAFFDSESTRVVRFEKPAEGPNFDIVILHVCSLSWDDLREAGMDNDPFFRQFHLLFTSFNTATTYSGPALIRLMRANCGQTRHGDIYNNAPAECYLFTALSGSGFSTHVALNHDGKYGGFASDIKNHGRLPDEPLEVAGIAAPLTMFDDSPIFDDFQTLSRWWAGRLASGERAAAVYYNTVTLHDGTHWSNEKEWWKRDRRVQYREYLTKLFHDITRFMNTLSESGRDVVVLFVPEHGLALRGSLIQAPGLRDIPLPRITRVPAGVRFIGAGYSAENIRQQVVDKPASYLALSFMLSRFIEKDPFSPGGEVTRSFVDAIPQTDFMAENQNAMVFRIGRKHYFYGKEGKWIELSENELK